jgi:hypothetical protein
MQLAVRFIAVLVMLASHAVSADEPSPALAKDLQKLTESSPGAKALLAKTPRPGAMKFFGELGYHAAEASGWSFERMQSEFPALCSEGRLVATVHAEDGQHYVIYTTDGLGPFAGTVSSREGFVWLECGKSAQLKEMAVYYRYSVIDDIRGDILVATFSPRIVRDATVRTVFISHLYIHDGHIEVLKHVTEEYPILSK